MERVLELALKAAKEAELYEVSTEETQVRFEANRLKQLQTNQSTSTALRIIKDGKTGYATASGAYDLAKLVDSAVETAAFGAEAKFELPDKVIYPKVAINDPAVSAVPIKDMVAIGEAIIDAVTKNTPGIICEGGANRGTVTLKIVNSRGGKAEYKKTFFGIGMEGTLVEGTDMLFVGESESSCHPVADPSNVIKTMVRQLDLAKNKAKAPTKEMPVIFTPDGVMALVIPLMSAFNGKTVLEGASPLKDKTGEMMFDKRFSLTDDPTIAFQTGSRPCDDEGVPSRKTPLIQNGMVKEFYYDLQTAALAGKKSTGNGGRGRGGLPSPSPSAFVIAPGDTTFDDMVKNIEEGLLVEQLMGAEQGNLLAGDFSGNVLLGYKIENGKIVGRVKDTMVAGNVYKILKDIAAIGSESKWVGGFLSTPHICGKGLAVSGKG
ncbi:MAG TPA: TldD/PmbA family protein [Dehalococcoidales bacterium]|nr:TldD/PmbA family protein [Dehalococcoidales bacterium]